MSFGGPRRLAYGWRSTFWRQGLKGADKKPIRPPVRRILAAGVPVAASNDQQLTATLDDITVAIAQTEQHAQSLAGTLDGVTAAVSQAANHPQSLAATLDAVTVAGSQTANHPQSLSATLDSVTAAASQTAQHAQSGAATLDGVTVAVSQSVGTTNAQTLAVTLDGVAFAGTQATATAAQVGYSPKRKKVRYYAEVGGMRMLFPTAEARQRALDAENPVEVAAEVIKKATVKAKPAVVVAPVEVLEVVEPEWDDEEDIEMLLMAL